jgi:hypothetical protein
MGRGARAKSFLAIAGLLGAFLADDGAAVSADSYALRYRVKHATYGDIGTYSNTVERTGDTTTVLTEAHFKVSLLGIVLHREDARRTERWRGDRLVFFHGVTTKNGQPVELRGESAWRQLRHYVAARHRHGAGRRPPSQSLVGELPRLRHDDAR